MSNQPNVPTKEPEYEFGVSAPPFFVRKQKGKAAPEVHVQRGAKAPVLNVGDAIIIAMAQRIQLLELAAGAHVTAQVDRNVICKLGELLLGSGKRNYSAEAVHRAIVWMVANDPAYFQVAMQNFRQHMEEEILKAIQTSSPIPNPQKE